MELTLRLELLQRVRMIVPSTGFLLVGKSIILEIQTILFTVPSLNLTLHQFRAVLGQMQVPCSLTFATGQGNTKVFHELIVLSLASPANVPDVLTFVFLALIGSVIGVALFAGERTRGKVDVKT
jgi:hypothetical protein